MKGWAWSDVVSALVGLLLLAAVVFIIVLILMDFQRTYVIAGYTPVPGERVTCRYERQLVPTFTGKQFFVTERHVLHCVEVEGDRSDR